MRWKAKSNLEVSALLQLKIEVGLSLQRLLLTVTMISHLTHRPNWYWTLMISCCFSGFAPNLKMRWSGSTFICTGVHLQIIVVCCGDSRWVKVSWSVLRWPVFSEEEKVLLDAINLVLNYHSNSKPSTPNHQDQTLKKSVDWFYFGYNSNP